MSAATFVRVLVLSGGERLRARNGLMLKLFYELGVRRGELAAFLDQARLLLAKASEGGQAGYEGADRWLDHQQRTVERAEEIWAILKDPDVPNGTVIRLSAAEPEAFDRVSWIAQSALGRPQ